MKVFTFILLMISGQSYSQHTLFLKDSTITFEKSYTLDKSQYDHLKLMQQKTWVGKLGTEEVLSGIIMFDVNLLFNAGSLTVCMKHFHTSEIALEVIGVRGNKLRKMKTFEKLFIDIDKKCTIQAEEFYQSL